MITKSKKRIRVDTTEASFEDAFKEVVEESMEEEKEEDTVGEEEDHLCILIVVR